MTKTSNVPNWLLWAAWSKHPALARWAWKRIAPRSEPFVVPDGAFRLALCGDLNFDPVVRSLWCLGLHSLEPRAPKRTIIRRIRGRLWRAFCRWFISPQYFTNDLAPSFREYSFRKPADESKLERDEFLLRSWEFNIDYSSVTDRYAYPFVRIAPFLKSKDLVLANLETPLSTHPRVAGLFESDPGYAVPMRKAGISVVNLANNHIFDEGEAGLFETLRHLDAAGVRHVGIGKNYEDARRGTFIEQDGLKFAFLCYTQWCNARFSSMAAGHPGLLPLNRELMVEDVARARPAADFVIVSLHWGQENQPNVHPAQIEIAHLLIDAGADCIAGHHPHVPQGIEVYKGRPILYSLGCLIFGQSNGNWTENFVAEIVIDGRQLRGVVLHPISAKDKEVFQPEVLRGERAVSLLRRLQLMSLPLNTGIAIHHDAGYIDLHPKAAARERPARAVEALAT
ncbi:MAG TPA: CapA family protein [Verrucomicrobiae bacterium]|nr:CapA family protein [Verrucomicrobiae bacterium]